jgi:hypothetical protein
VFAATPTESPNSLELADAELPTFVSCLGSWSGESRKNRHAFGLINLRSVKVHVQQHQEHSVLSRGSGTMGQGEKDQAMKERAAAFASPLGADARDYIAGQFVSRNRLDQPLNITRRQQRRTAVGRTRGLCRRSFRPNRNLPVSLFSPLYSKSRQMPERALVAWGEKEFRAHHSAAGLAASQ